MNYSIKHPQSSLNRFLLQNISVQRGEKQLLSNVNIKLEKGQNSVILGPNGCGKTTLVQIIMGLIFPLNGGKIYYPNKETSGGNLWEIRKSIGFVSNVLQENYLEDIFGFEVVISGFFSSIGLYQEISSIQKKIALKWIKKFRLDKISDKKFGTMSYGEKRKFLLARAMVHQPKWLLLDEPCTGLDPGSREEFLFYCQELIKDNCTLIYFTHSIEEIIPQMSHLITMDSGKIMQIGALNKLLNSENISKLYRKNLLVGRNGNRYYCIGKN